MRRFAGGAGSAVMGVTKQAIVGPAKAVGGVANSVLSTTTKIIPSFSPTHSSPASSSASGPDTQPPKLSTPAFSASPSPPLRDAADAQFPASGVAPALSESHKQHHMRSVRTALSLAVALLLTIWRIHQILQMRALPLIPSLAWLIFLYFMAQSTKSPHHSPKHPPLTSSPPPPSLSSQSSPQPMESSSHSSSSHSSPLPNNNNLISLPTHFIRRLSTTFPLQPTQSQTPPTPTPPTPHHDSRSTHILSPIANGKLMRRIFQKKLPDTPSSFYTTLRHSRRQKQQPQPTAMDLSPLLNTTKPWEIHASEPMNHGLLRQLSFRTLSPSSTLSSSSSIWQNKSSQSIDHFTLPSTHTDDDDQTQLSDSASFQTRTTHSRPSPMIPQHHHTHPMFLLRGVDVFTTNRQNAPLPAIWKQTLLNRNGLRHSPTFLLNFMTPFANLCIYWEMPHWVKSFDNLATNANHQHDSQYTSDVAILKKFLSGNSSYRNSCMKILPFPITPNGLPTLLREEQDLDESWISLTDLNVTWHQQPFHQENGNAAILECDINLCQNHHDTNNQKTTFLHRVMAWYQQSLSNLCMDMTILLHDNAQNENDKTKQKNSKTKKQSATPITLLLSWARLMDLNLEAASILPHQNAEGSIINEQHQRPI